MESQYWIKRGDTTLGPCSAADVRQFLTYRSVSPEDTIRQGQDAEWTPLSDTEFCAAFDPNLGARSPRRRIARYREFHRVPHAERSTTVFGRLFVGWWLPWRLWGTASTIFSQRIYRRSKDDKGFLKVWPDWMDGVVTALIVLNIIFWLTAATQLYYHLGPLLAWIQQMLDTALPAPD